MKIGVLNEPNDPRVALVPDTISRLEGENVEVLVERGAGAEAHYSDEAYHNAGARLEGRSGVLEEASLIVTIAPLTEAETEHLKHGAVIIAQYEPFAHPERLDLLAGKPFQVFSTDMIPRTTLAQSMDVLSSMASIAGYRAVVEAAANLPRYFPMLTTAAGTVPPAKVLVLGAGVAGLQAVATARRMGAIVDVFDTRQDVKEQVESLGAKFVEVEGARDDSAAGGYAVEQSDAYQQRQAAKIKEKAAQADVVITTAQLRGKRAPLLIDKDTLNEMKPGSVVVDLAASTGGNCIATKDNATIQAYGVTVVGNSHLASLLPVHASQLYSRNIYNYTKLFHNQGELSIQWDNEIVSKSCLVKDGEVLYGKPATPTA